MRSSLEEVCKRAAQSASEVLADGKKLTRVRTWAGDQLVEARRKGETVHRAEDRARILLRAVQEKKLWVPDPIGVEHIVNARHTACDDHDANGVCVKIGDCDDQIVLLAACFMAVGLYTMVVGHSYSRDKVIGHVLTKVYFNGKWHYADPSPLGNGEYLPLGKSAPYTRERYYSLPTIKVVCDAESCDVRNFDPLELGFVEKGTFVGVNGIAVEEMPPPAPRVQWLGEVEWLGDTSGDVVKSATKECVETYGAAGELDTKSGREKAFKSTGKCAADAACTAYSKGVVPPGTCGTIVGPLLDQAVAAWNSIFGDEEAERARRRDLNTAKFVAIFNKMMAADAAWNAYYWNTMTRLIKLHDKLVPAKSTEWGGGVLTSDTVSWPHTGEPGIPDKFKSFKRETFANSCPVLKKLVERGAPSQTHKLSKCPGSLAPSSLDHLFNSWSAQNPNTSAVVKTNKLEQLLNETLPAWNKSLDKAALELQNELIAEAVRHRLQSNEPSSEPASPNSGVKTAAAAGAVAGAGLLAVKYLLPYLSKVFR